MAPAPSGEGGEGPAGLGAALGLQLPACTEPEAARERTTQSGDLCEERGQSRALRPRPFSHCLTGVVVLSHGPSPPGGP